MGVAIMSILVYIIDEWCDNVINELIDVLNSVG